MLAKQAGAATCKQLETGRLPSAANGHQRQAIVISIVAISGSRLQDMGRWSKTRYCVLGSAGAQLTAPLQAKPIRSTSAADTQKTQETGAAELMCKAAPKSNHQGRFRLLFELNVQADRPEDSKAVRSVTNVLRRHVAVHQQ
jgi:hypothetical protein